MGLTRRDLLRSGVAGAGLLAIPGVIGTAQASHSGAATDAMTHGTWYAGDTHVHCDHSSDGSMLRQGSSQMLPGNVSVADQIGQGERIGLDWMPLTDHRTYDQHWDPLWTSSALLLVPGEEANGAPHAICLGALDVVVDGARPPGSASHRHLQQSIWEAHAQDASWGVAHPDSVSDENLSALGPDHIEVWNASSVPDAEIDYAEARWNAGFRSGVSGACDCHFREVWFVEGPGQPTTWVHARELTERSIVDGIRAGHTTVSTLPVGPMVTLEADLDGDGVYEAIGGDEVLGVPGTRGTLRINVERGAGTTVLVYASPGRQAGPIETFTVTGTRGTYVVPVVVPPGTAWWRAEVRRAGQPAGIGTDPNGDIPKSPDQLQSIASPIFVTSGAPAVPLGAAPTPAPSGTDEGSVVLGELGIFAGFSDVAVGSHGPHVVAEEHRSGRSSVVYRDPKGDETVIADGSARLPKVAASGKHVWVVWQDERAGQLPHNPQIYLRHSADRGRTWSAEQKLSDGVGRQERPAIALLPTGQPVIAWQAATGGAVDVLVRIVGVDTSPRNVSAPTKVIVPGTPADTRSAIYPASLFPDVAALPDGTVSVVWQDNRYDPNPGWTGSTPPPGQPSSGVTNPDSWEPMVALRRPASTTWSNPVRVGPRADRAGCHPAIAAAPNGLLACAWDSRELKAQDANSRIRAATSVDGGATWTSVVDVDPAPDYFAQRPRLAADPDGTMRMVWYDSRSADWRWQVRTALLAGSTWVPQGSVLAAGACTWPALDSGVVVATSDRGARLQRDRTQRIVLAELPLD